MASDSICATLEKALINMQHSEMCETDIEIEKETDKQVTNEQEDKSTGR